MKQVKALGRRSVGIVGGELQVSSCSYTRHPTHSRMFADVSDSDQTDAMVAKVRSNDSERSPKLSWLLSRSSNLWGVSIPLLQMLVLQRLNLFWRQLPKIGARCFLLTLRGYRTP